MKKIEFMNGEHYMLATAPFYKRRYTWDGDLKIGCNIGCKFCYYRWIDATVDYIGTGKLRHVATPEEAVQFLQTSKLFRKDRDIVMLCARSDGSMQVREITDFLKVFPYRNLVFILHRGYFGQKQLESWANDARVVFCTTITPRANELGWTPIKEKRQLEGLKFLINNGVSPRRISVEVGPLNEENIDKGVQIIHALDNLDLEFFTYRGCSVGSFGVSVSEENLQKMKFIKDQPKCAPEGHVYYKMKNVLSKEVETKVLQAVSSMRVHRFTGTLYRDEFGIDVAYNRNNRWRRELGQWERIDIVKLDAYLNWIGYNPVDITVTEEGYMVELPTTEIATEDVAMTVGAEFRTSVLFNNYRIAPTLGDVSFYAQNSLFHIKPEGGEFW